jgi:DNA-binding MarR family transcriptional regulator
MEKDEARCAVALMELVPLVIRTIRREMRSHRADLSLPQFRSLAYLDRNQGASLSELAEFIGLTLSAVSRMVEGLVIRGLATRRESAEDRRFLVLELTPAGRKLLEEARAATQDRLAGMLRELPAEEREGVIHALHLLRPLFEPGDGERG